MELGRGVGAGGAGEHVAGGVVGGGDGGAGDGGDFVGGVDGAGFGGAVVVEGAPVAQGVEGPALVAGGGRDLVAGVEVAAVGALEAAEGVVGRSFTFQRATSGLPHTENMAVGSGHVTRDRADATGQDPHGFELGLRTSL